MKRVNGTWQEKGIECRVKARQINDTHTVRVFLIVKGEGVFNPGNVVNLMVKGLKTGALTILKQ